MESDALCETAGAKINLISSNIWMNLQVSKDDFSAFLTNNVGIKSTATCQSPWYKTNEQHEKNQITT